MKYCFYSVLRSRFVSMLKPPGLRVCELDVAIWRDICFIFARKNASELDYLQQRGCRTERGIVGLEYFRVMRLIVIHTASVWDGTRPGPSMIVGTRSSGPPEGMRV